MEYIIVQAGGKGTRLEYLTENKPKALVPVENLPMLFHLFRKYPDKRFVIIADYKKDVLRKYLAAFADVKYQMVDASGAGTCGGIRQALELIPDGEPFMLMWSDLILPKDFCLPEDYLECRKARKNYVGISQTFSCRWSFESGLFKEEKSVENGVAGFFLFKNKEQINDVPESGELVRWLSNKDIIFSTVGLSGTREFGLLEEYKKIAAPKYRPFNKITVEGEVLTKEPVDEQGIKLAKRETAWYEKARLLNIPELPKIFATQPLQMEYIHGRNIYDCDFSYEEKKKILKTWIDALKVVHKSGTCPTDTFSIQEAYFNKTMMRLSQIQNMLPFGTDETVVVNGKRCRNVFYHIRQLEEKLDALKTNCKEFAFIHGDCTFSNLMVREDNSPVFIDPRGYFGYMEIYGDARYDWAKLYYSIVGNYDQFNLKRFRLHIHDNKEVGVELDIESNHWEDLEKDFFEYTGADEFEIKLLHAIIWLSLTTYAWQDYDSVCGAFYNGLWYLEEVL